MWLENCSKELDKEMNKFTFFERKKPRVTVFPSDISIIYLGISLSDTHIWQPE